MGKVQEKERGEPKKNRLVSLNFCLNFIICRLTIILKILIKININIIIIILKMSGDYYYYFY